MRSHHPGCVRVHWDCKERRWEASPGITCERLVFRKCGGGDNPFNPSSLPASLYTTVIIIKPGRGEGPQMMAWLLLLSSVCYCIFHCMRDQTASYWLSSDQSACYWLSSDETECYWLSIDQTACNWLSSDKTACYRLSTEQTTCNWLSSDETACYWLSSDQTACNWLSRDQTAFNEDLLTLNSGNQLTSGVHSVSILCAPHVCII